jgi:hypothetical protein
MMAEGARKEWLTVGFELRTSHRRIIQNSQGKELSAPGAIEAKVIFAFLPLHGFDGLIAVGRNVNCARHLSIMSNLMTQATDEPTPGPESHPTPFWGTRCPKPNILEAFSQANHLQGSPRFKHVSTLALEAGLMRTLEPSIVRIHPHSDRQPRRDKRLGPASRERHRGDRSVQ